MIYAKSLPKQSLKEHTDDLLSRLKTLKAGYENLLPRRVWELLYWAALYHDAGKVYTPFQNTIKKALGLPGESTSFSPIPHNYLSPFFVPLDSLHLTKPERTVLLQAIAYHHERNEQPDKNLLKVVFREELIHKLKTVHQELNADVPSGDEYLIKVCKAIDQRIKEPISNGEGVQLYYLYVLIKGLLHRLDHAASADAPIEVDMGYDLGHMAHTFLLSKYGQNKQTTVLRPLQKFAHQNQNKNLIIVAQTGMGKTEAALLWAGQRKTFFTLPIRVSLNSLYDRVREEMGFSGVGLLHATSASHLDKNGDEQWEVIFDQSKHLANKLLFTTIDQILKFPFKFKGYEKFYATMAYSCLVIDEIQAYSPWIVAVLIRAVEMIHKIGGRFLIMTATLPPIYLDELKKRGVVDELCVYQEFMNDMIRHRLAIVDKPIIEGVPDMLKDAQTKKVLVVVNTVDQAIAVYRQLKQIQEDNIFLLHSRFIQRDRAMLETHLKDFEQDEQATGIWVTTQLVEASIDIDFDVLYTELSTIDSLLQRFGRCYRKRTLDHEKPNVHIFTAEASGRSSVYDPDILDLTLQFIKPFAGKVITEEDKIQLVKQVYSRESLKESRFLSQFEKALHELDNMLDYQWTNDEAQSQLRNMKTRQVIPRSVFDEILPVIDELQEEKDAKRRAELRRQIETFTVSVSERMYKGFFTEVDCYGKTASGKVYPLLSYISILEKKYDFDPKKMTGIGVQKEENDWEFMG